MNKANKVASEISQDSEDPIASVATLYIQKKSSTTRKVYLGSISFIHIKPTGGEYRIPKSAWQAMSEDERQDTLNVI
jgi:hypothetical protein